MDKNMCALNVKRLLKLFGNPHESFRIVHCAGTNGKGGFCHALSIKLSKHTCVGLFVSPFLLEKKDSVRVDGKMCEEFEELWSEVGRVDDERAGAVDNKCSFFERLWVTACLVFREKGVRVGVIEVGVGGEGDATNVFGGGLSLGGELICVLMRVALDHMDILGDTVEKIAYVKCGIFKRECRVVSVVQCQGVMEVVRDRCAELGCVLEVCEENKAVNIVFKMVLDDLGLIEQEEENNESSVWAGRLHWMRLKGLGVVIIDGAHNTDGVEYLGRYIKSCGVKHVKILLGVARGRDPGMIVKGFRKAKISFGDASEGVSVVSIDVCGFEDVEGMPWVKSTEPASLAECMKEMGLQDIGEYKNVEAWITVKDIKRDESGVEYEDIRRKDVLEDTITLVCGSLYLASSFLRFINYQI